MRGLAPRRAGSIAAAGAEQGVWLLQDRYRIFTD